MQKKILKFFLRLMTMAIMNVDVFFAIINVEFEHFKFIEKHR